MKRFNLHYISVNEMRDLSPLVVCNHEQFDGFSYLQWNDSIQHSKNLDFFFWHDLFFSQIGKNGGFSFGKYGRLNMQPLIFVPWQMLKKPLALEYGHWKLFRIFTLILVYVCFICFVFTGVQKLDKFRTRNIVFASHRQSNFFKAQAFILFHAFFLL